MVDNKWYGNNCWCNLKGLIVCLVHRVKNGSITIDPPYVGLPTGPTNQPIDKCPDWELSDSANQRTEKCPALKINELRIVRPCKFHELRNVRTEKCPATNNPPSSKTSKKIVRGHCWKYAIGMKIHFSLRSNCYVSPPMMVLMSEAWPGQSTSVYCTTPVSPCWARWVGRSSWNEENPRSRVIPRSLLCGFLSKQAVLAVVLRAFDRLVLPLSTWPRTPTLKLNMGALGAAILSVTWQMSIYRLHRG